MCLGSGHLTAFCKKAAKTMESASRTKTWAMVASGTEVGSTSVVPDVSVGQAEIPAPSVPPVVMPVVVDPVDSDVSSRMQLEELPSVVSDEATGVSSGIVKDVVIGIPSVALARSKHSLLGQRRAL